MAIPDEAMGEYYRLLLALGAASLAAEDWRAARRGTPSGALARELVGLAALRARTAAEAESALRAGVRAARELPRRSRRPSSPRGRARPRAGADRGGVRDLALGGAAADRPGRGVAGRGAARRGRARRRRARAPTGRCCGSGAGASAAARAPEPRAGTIARAVAAGPAPPRASRATGTASGPSRRTLGSARSPRHSMRARQRCAHPASRGPQAAAFTRRCVPRYTPRSARRRPRALGPIGLLRRKPFRRGSAVFENSTACASTIRFGSWCASRFDPSAGASSAHRARRQRVK